MIIQTSPMPGGTAGLDDAPGRNGEPPAAWHIASAAVWYNTLAARMPRTLFCQHNTDPSITANPLHRLRFNQNWENGGVYRVTALSLPPFLTPPPPPAAGDPRADMIVTIGAAVGTQGGMEIEEDRDVPERLRDRGHLLGRDTPGGAYINPTIGTRNAYRLYASAIQELSYPAYGRLDTTRLFAVNSDRFRAVRPVVDDPLAALRSMEEHEWLAHRPVLASWSAMGFADARSIAHNGTTFSNLFDTTLTVRTINTPGEVCSVKYAANGRQTAASGGIRTRARYAVYARADNLGGGQTGEVRFTSSQGSADITGITAAGWYAGATNDLLLDARPAATSTDGRDWDKVDILGRVTATGAGQIVRVWAFMIMGDP